MMVVILTIVTAIVSTGIAWSTFIQTYRYLWQPQQAVIPPHEFNQWPTTRRWRFYAEMLGSFIGLGYCIYKGVEGTFWFIPKSWRVTNDDGETEWVVHGIAFTIAVYGAVLIMGKLDELAKDRVARLNDDSRRERLR